MKAEEIYYETPLTKLLFNKASKARIPISGTFELSPVCNFDCRMCYVRQTQEQVDHHHRKMMTLEQWKRIADQAKNQGMLYLLLTGGEPFLWPDFWKLYEYLIKQGFVISINSNGSLIDDEAIRHLKEMPPSRINITLYGGCEETYQRLCRTKNGYQKVDYAIDQLKEAGILTKLNCSLTPYNICDLERMIAYAEEKKLILETNSYMFPPLRKDPTRIGENDRFTPEEAAYWHIKRYQLQYGEERYLHFLEGINEGLIDPMGLDESCYDPIDGKVSCRAGNAAFWVTWDGYLLPCGMMPEPKVDLTFMDFEKAWKELNEKTEHVMLSGICTKCNNRGICHSCAAMAIAETGEFHKVPRYLCEMIEAMKKIAKEQLKIIESKNKKEEVSYET